MSSDLTALPGPAPATPTGIDDVSTRFAAIVQMRKHLINFIVQQAVARGLVNPEAAARAPIPWLLTRMRLQLPGLSRELDAVGRKVATSEQVLQDPNVSVKSVGELVDAAKLVMGAIASKTAKLQIPEA